MRGESVAATYRAPSGEFCDVREDLVQRVQLSSTFERSPRLRAFLLYVCRCALDNDPAAATEQQIGIHVFGRSPGYNPNEDNIVRSQARLLRLKLEHHFANEGKDEAVIITIPRGRYLPMFEKRPESAPATPEQPTAPQADAHTSRRVLVKPAVILAAAVAMLILALLWGGFRLGSSSWIPRVLAFSRTQPQASQASSTPPFLAPSDGGIRIAAGRIGSSYVDPWGHRWGADQFYVGGTSQPGPQEIFPPVAESDLFKTIREGAADKVETQGQGEFRYAIPVPAGVYELRLFFADPVRNTEVERRGDAQNVRHFQVNVNGQPVLWGFDAVADSGTAPVDVRTFKDVRPAEDGKVHIDFIPSPERPFVNAIELTPGIPGKIKPIRFSAHKNEIVDSDGIRWSGDDYFINGRSSIYVNPEVGPRVPELYSVERFGNFSYAIPVPPGSYTLKLHFMESFFGPIAEASGLCRGTGCRVFDVTCNGTMLLHDFDIYQAAGGALHPLVRTFEHLHPNGQGQLLISFAPKVNYAEVRAIEVIDESK